MRRLTTIAWIVAGALALGCGAGATGGGSEGGGGSGGEGDALAKIGQPVRDGKFEFTVQGVKCGVGKVGPELLEEKAQGQFCLITVRVKNIGKEAQTFSDSNQKAFAADGTEYSTNTAAGLVANEDANVFLKEINPGNQITGVIVFDVPKNATVTRLELHDSAFSGGVGVALT
jgi:hypothetical protein